MELLNAAQRRAAVVRVLEEAGGPVSAAALAKRFSVSRQIIVGDVALLRAAGMDISATPRGYVAGTAAGGGVFRQVACIHPPEGMEQELTAVVDAGGEVVDVVVTEQGIAVNPRRPDLKEKIEAAGLHVFTIEQLQRRAAALVGVPEPIRYKDRIVGVVMYRDNTIIDVVHEIDEDA